MRIKNLFRNSFFSMLSQFALLILGFFSQRAMNLYMGAELVGMNGVISNVINILSVTDPFSEKHIEIFSKIILTYHQIAPEIFLYQAFLLLLPDFQLLLHNPVHPLSLQIQLPQLRVFRYILPEVS